MRQFRDTTFIISIFFSLAQVNVGFVDLYYFYILIIVLFPMLALKYQTVDRDMLVVFSTLLVLGMINVTLQNNEFSQLLKVFISTLLFYWLYYLILKDENFNLTHFFRLYYKASVVAAYIGLFQFVSFLIHFKPGYNFGWLGLRMIGTTEMGGSVVYPVHSIFGEPAAFALVLGPTIYMVLDRLKNHSNFLNIRKRDAYVIIIAYLLTQSSTGYIAFLFCLLLLNLNRISVRGIVAAVVVVPGVIFSLYSASPKFKDRLDSSISLISGEIIIDAIQSGSEANGSSLILFNHFIIAKKNAMDHFFGTGLGSHHVAFHKYNTLKTYFTGYGPNSMILNLNDGSSLFNRILSEAGFPGLALTLIFLFIHFIRSGPPELVLINHSALVMLFTCLLRGGHYFLFGLPFFILVYYYSSKFAAKHTREAELPQSAP